MKKISEHLGQIIVALASVALLVAAVVVFKAPIGEFYNTVLGKEASISDTVLEGIDNIDLGDLSGGASGPVMLDGNGQTVSTFALGPVRFRSSAPMDELQSVQINGETVSSENYTVSEGSTIITLKPDYITTLALGAHEIDINSQGGTASGNFTVTDEVPNGANVYEGATSSGESIDMSTATEITPEEFAGRSLELGDVFEYGDYKYWYSPYISGWRVFVLDKTKTEYGPIFSHIAGEPVTSMESTFANCTNLITAPEIPNSVNKMFKTFSGCISLTTVPAIPNVSNMQYAFENCTSLVTAPKLSGATHLNYTFQNCTSLTTAPAIPSNVCYMSFTFYGCTNLTTAPDLRGCTDLRSLDNAFTDCTSLTDLSDFVIPSSVTKMSATFAGCTNLTAAPAIPGGITTMGQAFYGCTSLTGTIIIHANPTVYQYCFEGTAQPITLTGRSTLLAKMAATAKNGNVTVAE